MSDWLVEAQISLWAYECDTHMNEWRQIYECDTHMNESRQTYDWHTSHLHGSCHTHEDLIVHGIRLDMHTLLSENVYTQWWLCGKVYQNPIAIVHLLGPCGSLRIIATVGI